MRLFWILIAFMLGVTAAAIDTANAHPNLITNYDFETWSGGVNVPPDGFALSGVGAAVARNDTEKYIQYSAKVTAAPGQNANLYFDYPGFATLGGHTVTAGIWANATSPGIVRLWIYDGATNWKSSYHTGNELYQFLTVSANIQAVPTILRVSAYVESEGFGIFDGAILVDSPSISYSVDNSTMSLPFAYRCQDVVINTNITGDGIQAGITAVTAFVNSSSAVQVSGVPTTASESVVMSLVSGTHWQGTLGNDANRLRGLRDVSYRVTQNENVTEQPPNATLLFFPDTCTGTGSNFSTQVTCPMGTYLCRMWTGEENFLEMSIHPWTDQWGYIFYFIVLCIICMVVYMKNQQVQQPLIIALIGLALMATTTAIPDSYKQPIVMLLGISLGALFYRLYIKRS